MRWPIVPLIDGQSNHHQPPQGGKERHMLFPFFFAKYILSSHDNYDLKWGPFSPYPSRNVYDWASTCYWSRRQQ